MTQPALLLLSLQSSDSRTVLYEWKLGSRSNVVKSTILFTRRLTSVSKIGILEKAVAATWHWRRARVSRSGLHHLGFRFQISEAGKRSQSFYRTYPIVRAQHHHHYASQHKASYPTNWGVKLSLMPSAHCIHPLGFVF